MMQTDSFSLAVRLIILLLLMSPAAGAEPDAIEFVRDVAPILQRHCIRCHGPGNKKSDVSLASPADLREQQYLLPGDAAASELIHIIGGEDGERPRMPEEGNPLTSDQVDVIRRWIDQGADWPDDVVVCETVRADASWWSLQPLAEWRLPRNETAPIEWQLNPVDRFVWIKLAENLLQPNPPADRRTLIRRATYDLIGLPPTPEEVEEFVADSGPNAWEKLIDRLLDSPHYGERWGRHWLDVVRFGESIGYERNVIINDLWPFRDYVIRSISEDKPFDAFIREHLAGDVFGKDDPHVAVGSAFLVAGPFDDVGNQDAVQAAQIRANTIDEMIRATGDAFLGMTLGCARCHDHKFDAITQRDYYGLYATFAGVRHDSVELATPEARADRAAKLRPLREQKAALEKIQSNLRLRILERARRRLTDHKADWTRRPPNRSGTEEQFDPVRTKLIRLVCEAQDISPHMATGFRIDEFEVWSNGTDSKNVALAVHGGKATGSARKIEDFPDAYGPQLTIDGLTRSRFISTGPDLTIELAEPTMINRVVFSSAKGELIPENKKFVFVAEYRIEVSDDGESWREVASSHDRKPVNNDGHLDARLIRLETTPKELAEQARITRELAALNRQIAEVPSLPTVWIGRRAEEDAKGAFHVFLGGSPQKKGEEVVPASLSTFSQSGEDGFSYRLAADTPESERRQALADWIVHPDNPLTWRVLANRLWHYHFGTGIVDTPSDFGWMGGQPTHPELLDLLAIKLKGNGWRIKTLHRLIMNSETYRQSSMFRDEAAGIDGDSRLLWRFPPRRLSAEEIRDTILHVSGRLDRTRGGQGFRLYHFMQDNVCTYVPLDRHGPETFRRAVYHQNARASVVDLMTEFDQPDCTFSAPRRGTTTTPLQALTLLNHSFTETMADAMSERLKRDVGADTNAQILHAWQLCYARRPTDEETTACCELINSHSLSAFCRVLLNTSELIYVR